MVRPRVAAAAVAVAVAIAALAPGSEVAVAPAPRASAPAPPQAAIRPYTSGSRAHEPAPAVQRLPLPTGTLRASVRDDRGAPDPAAWVEAIDCPGLRPAGAAAPHTLGYTAFAGRCVVRAVRHDGLFRTEGAPVTVQIPPDGEARAALPIPSRRTGGVQFAFQPAHDGVRVLWTHPEVEVLARDDVVVSVEGTRLAELDPHDVVALLTGPEGAVRTFEVLLAGDTAAEPVILEIPLRPVAPP